MEIPWTIDKQMVSERREHGGIKSTESSSFLRNQRREMFAGMMKDGEKTYDLSLTTHATVVRISIIVTVILSALLPVSLLTLGYDEDSGSRTKQLTMNITLT